MIPGQAAEGCCLFQNVTELGPLFVSSLVSALFTLDPTLRLKLALSSCRMKTPFLDSTRISVHISYSRDNKTRHGGAHLLTHHLGSQGRRIAMNSRPTLAIQKIVSQYRCWQWCTVRLPSRRPTEVVSLCSGTPAPESPRVLPWMSSRSLYLSPSSLAFISQLCQTFRSRSDQGIILAEGTKFNHKEPLLGKG